MDNRSVGFLLLLTIATLFFRYNFDSDHLKQNNDSEEHLTVNHSERNKSVVGSIEVDNYDSIFNDLKNYKNNNEKFKDDCDCCEYIENNYIKIGFSKHNGAVQSVKLNKYKNYNNEDVELIDNTFVDNIHIVLEDDDIYDSYKSKNVELLKNDGKNITFKDTYKCKNGDYLVVENVFGLCDQQNRYELKRYIKIYGYTGTIKNISLQIYDNIKRQETNAEICSGTIVIKYLDKDSNIGNCYVDDKYISCPDSLKWLNIMQKFFSVGIASSSEYNGELKNVKVKLCNYDDDTKEQKYLRIAKIILNPFNDNKREGDGVMMESNLKYYFGPNIANYMSSFSTKFDKSLYFGILVVRTFNRYVVDKIIKILHNIFGIHSLLVLLLLMILFYLLYLPFFVIARKTQKKRELLEPTIQHINEKYSKNINQCDYEIQKLCKQAKIGYKSAFFAGFLQIFFFTSMLNIIPNEISLRNEQFLWCKDLSNYDSILDFSFSIPLYGNHVSLFTLISLFLLLLISFIKSKISQYAYKKQDNSILFRTFFSFFIILCFNNHCAALQIFYFCFMHIISIVEYFTDNVICSNTAIENELVHDVPNFKKVYTYE